MESHVHRKNSEIAVIKLQSSNVFSSHCSKLDAYLSSMTFCSHRPSGISVKIVRIEPGTNGRTCYQHDVCGSLVEEDVVLSLLRKIQIKNSFGHFTLLTALKHHVGFLPCHFVPHAPSFDGVLVQVTEVYSSPTSSKSMSGICRSLKRMGITPTGADSMYG